MNLYRKSGSLIRNVWFLKPLHMVNFVQVKFDPLVLIPHANITEPLEINPGIANNRLCSSTLQELDFIQHVSPCNTEN